MYISPRVADELLATAGSSLAELRATDGAARHRARWS